MPKAVRIGIWLTFVASTLVMQGCWEEQQKQKLTLLGDGGCRTADGGDGGPTYTSATSTEECEAQCFVSETPCTAVEYNASNNTCEIHHQPIAKFEKVEGVACYAMR